MGTLFIGAIPFRSDEATIRKLVEPYGKVKSVEVHADWNSPTHEPYALIEMDSVRQAAVALDGEKVGPTYLRVHERK